MLNQLNFTTERNFYKISNTQLDKLLTIQEQWKEYIKNLKGISDISKWDVTELRNIKKEIVGNNYFTAEMQDIKGEYNFGFIPIDLTAKIHCEKA